MKIPIIFFSISKNSNQQQTNTQKLTMSLESILKTINDLELTKKDLRDIIKVATEKKKVAPNKTGSKTRKKKDPNAPKRGKSSYMYWCADYRENHKDEGKFSAKVLGPIWSEMDDEEKQPFVELATADNERYKTEMEAYKSDSDGSDTESKDEEVKSEDESVLTASDEEAVGVGLEDDAPDFEDGDEETPKKPIEPAKNKNAYKHFEELYVVEHADRKYKSKELKKIWNELEDKSDYEEMAKADKKRYKQQMKDYEKDLEKYQKAQLKIEEGDETEDLTDFEDDDEE